MGCLTFRFEQNQFSQDHQSMRTSFLGWNVFFDIITYEIAPILSLLATAEKAKTAATSSINSFFDFCRVPKLLDPEISKTRNTDSSLSSSKTLINGSLNRAVTFQSIFLTSSPYW